jgi:hypothetical protein
VRAIQPGLPLFLYNYTTHQLHGVFEVSINLDLWNLLYGQVVSSRYIVDLFYQYFGVWDLRIIAVFCFFPRGRIL